MPAYNLAIRNIGEATLSHLGQLPGVNNLAPLENVGIDVGYRTIFTGTVKEAKLESKSKITKLLSKTTLELSYQDLKRREHKIIIGFEGEELTISR
jgi:hypothetical protein